MTTIQMTSDTDVAIGLVERMGHLENVLTGSLLSFLITTALSIFGGLLLISDDDKSKLTGTDVLMAVSLMYALLSGYYYFMLGHYYATVIALVPIADGLENIDVEGFWVVFEIPIWFLPDEMRNISALLGVPLYPLLFSGVVIFGVGRVMQRIGVSGAPKTRHLIEAFLLQVFVMVWVVSAPFLRFLEATALR